jgi:lipopolysaccharide transport protein LptA
MKTINGPRAGRLQSKIQAPWSRRARRPRARAAATFILLISAGTVAQMCAQAVGSPAQSMAAAGTEKTAKEKKDKSTSNKLFQPDGKAPSNEPTTTEIYADEAFFDSNKNMGIFSGRVKVTDPRFNLQSEKLTVFISKGEKQGLEKAIAEGNVAVVRDRPDPNGGPPTRAVGRSDQATYIAATGDMELKGTPRVQEGINTHLATSPDTVMIINQNGELNTHGPSRTEIRQQPESQPSPSASASASPTS